MTQHAMLYYDRPLRLLHCDFRSLEGLLSRKARGHLGLFFCIVCYVC